MDYFQKESSENGINAIRQSNTDDSVVLHEANGRTENLLNFGKERIREQLNGIMQDINAIEDKQDLKIRRRRSSTGSREEKRSQKQRNPIEVQSGLAKTNKISGKIDAVNFDSGSFSKAQQNQPVSLMDVDILQLSNIPPRKLAPIVVLPLQSKTAVFSQQPTLPPAKNLAEINLPEAFSSIAVQSISNVTRTQQSASTNTKNKNSTLTKTESLPLLPEPKSLNLNELEISLRGSETEVSKNDAQFEAPDSKKIGIRATMRKNRESFTASSIEIQKNISKRSKQQYMHEAWKDSEPHLEETDRVLSLSEMEDPRRPHHKHWHSTIKPPTEAELVIIRDLEFQLADELKSNTSLEVKVGSNDDPKIPKSGALSQLIKSATDKMDKLRAEKERIRNLAAIESTKNRVEPRNRSVSNVDDDDKPDDRKERPDFFTDYCCFLFWNRRRKIGPERVPLSVYEQQKLQMKSSVKNRIRKI